MKKLPRLFALAVAAALLFSACAKPEQTKPMSIQLVDGYLYFTFNGALYQKYGDVQRKLIANDVHECCMTNGFVYYTLANADDDTIRLHRVRPESGADLEELQADAGLHRLQADGLFVYYIRTDGKLYRFNAENPADEQLLTDKPIDSYYIASTARKLYTYGKKRCAVLDLTAEYPRETTAMIDGDSAEAELVKRLADGWLFDTASETVDFIYGTQNGHLARKPFVLPDQFQTELDAANRAYVVSEKTMGILYCLPLPIETDKSWYAIAVDSGTVNCVYTENDEVFKTFKLQNLEKDTNRDYTMLQKIPCESVVGVADGWVYYVRDNQFWCASADLSTTELLAEAQ
ncbi:MAG: DUF5050 domain-containing protein [Oscillospiraceae bacterium]|jgi:hypothetical protein|nr:DUF5050 domain-containing protein [Oscillospiraceae bacterium]